MHVKASIALQAARGMEYLHFQVRVPGVWGNVGLCGRVRGQSFPPCHVHAHSLFISLCDLFLRCLEIACECVCLCHGALLHMGR
jgi:hypothetical protein